jgi:hypothetical protein
MPGAFDQLLDLLGNFSIPLLGEVPSVAVTVRTLRSLDMVPGEV